MSLFQRPLILGCAIVAVGLGLACAGEPAAPSPSPAAPPPAREVGDRGADEAMTALSDARVTVSAATHPECGPVLGDGARPLGEVVAQLRREASDVTAACEGEGRRRCEVSMGNGSGEQEWAAVFRFEIRQGRLVPETLTCALAG